MPPEGELDEATLKRREHFVRKLKGAFPALEEMEANIKNGSIANAKQYCSQMHDFSTSAKRLGFADLAQWAGLAERHLDQLIAANDISKVLHPLRAAMSLFLGEARIMTGYAGAGLVGAVPSEDSAEDNLPEKRKAFVNNLEHALPSFDRFEQQLESGSIDHIEKLHSLMFLLANSAKTLGFPEFAYQAEKMVHHLEKLIAGAPSDNVMIAMKNSLVLFIVEARAILKQTQDDEAYVKT